MKFNINTQPVLKDIQIVEIYVPLFRTGSPEALLKLVIILNKILKGQYLFTGPQKYVITCNLVIR